MIPGGSTFALEVQDEDLTVNDPMFSCGGPLTADLQRAYTVTCASAAGTPASVGSSIYIWFQPL